MSRSGSIINDNKSRVSSARSNQRPQLEETHEAPQRAKANSSLKDVQDQVSRSRCKFGSVEELQLQPTLDDATVNTVKARNDGNLVEEAKSKKSLSMRNSILDFE